MKNKKEINLQAETNELRKMGYEVVITSFDCIDGYQDTGWTITPHKHKENIILIWDKRANKTAGIFYLESQEVYFPSDQGKDFIKVDKDEYLLNRRLSPRFYIIVGKMIEKLGWKN